METPNERLALLRVSLGFDRKALFAESVGIERSSYDKMEKGPNKPSVESLEKILAKYPLVNANWVLTGRGAMLLDSEGRALTPAPRAVAEPSADYTSGEATTATLYIEVLKEQVADLKTQVADLKVDKADLKAEVSELRGKPFDSSDAAGPTEMPLDPNAPTFAGGIAPQPRVRVQGLVRYAEEAAELS